MTIKRFTTYRNMKIIPWNVIDFNLLKENELNPLYHKGFNPAYYMTLKLLQHTVIFEYVAKYIFTISKMPA